MNQYSLSLVDIEPIDNKYYYRIRITTNFSSLHRDICVKIGDLMNLHRNLTSENYSHYFPPFPEKSFMSSWFGASDTREELTENKLAITNYLNGISRNPPLRNEPINQFVYNTIDPIRVRELKFQCCNKEQFYKINPKTSLIKKGKFGKIFRVKNIDRKEVMAVHQFLIPQQSDLGKSDMEAYKKAHSLITDYTYILKVYEIGQLVKSKPYKMFNKKQKKTIHNKMGFPPETTYDVYYAIEELAANSMNEMIHLRQQSLQHFELEHLADAMFTLVQASQYLQFLQISQRQFLLSNFFYSEQKGFKLGGLSPMLNFKRKYYLKMLNEANEYQAMTPPEQNGTLGYKVQFPSNKADVYQIGIIILAMCTLSQASELISQEQINDKLKITSKNYGELLALLIKGMLEKNPYDRITLQEISNGSQAILPMKLTYLNIKEKMKKIRLRINVFGIKELEDLDKLFREKSDLYYIIVLSLEQPIIPQVFLFYLERIRKEQIYSLYIHLNNQDLPSELMDKISNILGLYKLYNLTINLRNSSICEKGLAALTNVLHIAQKVVIDLTGVKDMRCLEFINEKITVYK